MEPSPLRHKVTSVRARAKALSTQTARALTTAGLLEATDGGLRADYAAIETTIAI